MQKLSKTTVFYYETSALGCRCVKYTEILSLLCSTSCDAIYVATVSLFAQLNVTVEACYQRLHFVIGHQVH